ncbi:MAG: hypothetical protein KKA10_00230 [Euryarchaeota archaeon]|nr:hypothetical protein [Euryarchaeota archaeon]MCG2736588.1 hypothetical protein [Candidatus Methanoperedenaceae archaeon]
MKFDNIELLRENIHRKDLQLIQKIRQRDILLIEERFKKCEQGGGWDNFVRIAESEADKGKEVVKVDFTPIEIMGKFIENNGDPSVYLKAISISHPGHPFCHMLIECVTVGQFLDRIKPLEAKFPIIFRINGKKWLSDLFEVLKGCVREEYESEMKALDIAGACA